MDENFSFSLLRGIEVRTQALKFYVLSPLCLVFVKGKEKYRDVFPDP